MDHITIHIRVTTLACYACGAETKMIVSIGLSSGDTNLGCSVTDYPELAELMAKSLRSKAEIGAIKPRFSRTMGLSYMSNGCAHCDALFGQHYEVHSRYGEYVAAEFTGTDSCEWRQIFNALLTSDDGHFL